MQNDLKLAPGHWNLCKKALKTFGPASQKYLKGRDPETGSRRMETAVIAALTPEASAVDQTGKFYFVVRLPDGQPMTTEATEIEVKLFHKMREIMKELPNG